MATARSEWGKALVFAEHARTVVRRAGIEETFVTPLACAVHARAALHRGDVRRHAGSWSAPSGCGIC